MNRIGVMLHAQCLRRRIGEQLPKIVTSLRGIWRSLFQPPSSED